MILPVPTLKSLIAAEKQLFPDLTMPIATFSLIGGMVIAYIIYKIVAAIWKKIKHSEALELYKEFLKAKKQQICPIVEIVDDEKG